MSDSIGPTVSVLMTAYNREAFIGDAIKSVLASDFVDFELVVVDDGSTDATIEIAHDQGSKDRRIRVFQNDKNLGDYPNRNRAASYARGKYLKYLDSDDILYPWGLGVLVRCMERFPEAGYGLSAHAHVDRPHPLLLSPEEAYREQFFGRELFGRAPGSAILRRAAFEEVGGFSSTRQLGDFEFWFKIGARYPLVTLPPALSWDRIHPGQEMNVNSETEKAAMRVAIVRAALSSPECPLDRVTRDAAIKAYQRGLAKVFWKMLLTRLAPSDALIFWRTVVHPAKQPLPA